MKNFRLAILLLLLTAAVGCSNGGDVPGGSGLLETDEVILSAETSGRVLSLAFDEGTAVNAGDTLAVIDPTRLELQLASAEAGRQVALANLESACLQQEQATENDKYARKEHDRVTTLFKSGSATEKQLDQLKHELTQASLAMRTSQAAVSTIESELARIDADINMIYRSLEDCYPVAPTLGVVTEKYIEPGELLSAGKPIAKISNLNSLWVKVYLPAGDFAHVKIGDRANIDTESGEKQYDGEVVWTSEEAEFTPKNIQTKKSRADLVYAVKVKIENSDGTLKIGMPVYVTLGE